MLGREIGSYRILEKIGQGGMGVVYKGVHTKLEQEVAIKVLSPQFSQDQHMRSRFFKEAKIQAKFSHPNVVNVLNYLESDGNIFLVMEYINGETLESLLKKKDRLSVEESVSASLSVMEALGFMHSKGVIHRDIKPANVMFTESGVVKVADFGIAKVMGEKGQTKTGMVGSFLYMSPEQILGEGASTLSDIYSLGITFYQMVTGRVPFNGDSEYKIMKAHLEERPLTPWTIHGDISKDVGMVILRAIAKNPKDRYQNVRGFAEDLKAAIKKPQKSSVLSQISAKVEALKASIPPLHFDMKWFLIHIGLAVIFLILTFAWQKPKPDVAGKAESPSTNSETLATNTLPVRLELSLVDVQVPEDITSEYILTALEAGDGDGGQQLPEVHADEETKPSPRRNTRLKMIYWERVDKRKELEKALRQSFLLPQP